ncbi:MAG TPA: ABC transporter substrate-binding protein, partial [Casimicrobiaceae bacterium]
MHHSLINLRAAGVLGVALALFGAPPVSAQQKIKVGLMLPYTGTYAALGTAITNGFKLAISEAGGKFGGREVEYITVDDESEPAKAPDN